MSGVGCGSSVASPQIVGESEVIDGTGESAIADTQEFAIPVRSRQPHFKPNFGIGAWPNYSRQTAKRGKFVEGSAGWRCESACGHGLGSGEGRIRQFCAAETYAVGSASGKGGYWQDKEQHPESAH
jgi:hypothetical protein